MKVLVALDSFKGSLSSLEAGLSATEGIKKAKPNTEVIVKPLSDGGEGTLDALINSLNGEIVEVPVHNPLGTVIKSKYGIIDNTAIIEIAQASGITLIKDLNPYKANTYGTGELIKNALDRNIRNFIIGLGGSATTEGGIGMLNSLGAKFYNDKNQELPPILTSLGKIRKISLENFDKRIGDSTFQLASDVEIPLYGSNGAVEIFGPQKGINKTEIKKIDEMMENYATVTTNTVNKDNSFKKGAGAAGGLGFAFLSYFPDSKIKSGFEIVNDLTGIENELADCDILLTGEGRLDDQTAYGKAPLSLAQLAKEKGVKKVIAIAGSVSPNATILNNKGIDAFFSIIQEPVSLKDAMNKETTRKNISRTVEQIFRIL